MQEREDEGGSLSTKKPPLDLVVQILSTRHVAA